MALLTKVKTTLVIHASRKVRGILDGRYASMVTGRSLDFSDLRTYVLGDDVKDIDWKATARHGEPLVKRFVADRKHTLVLAVATGRDFAANATPTETKRDVAIFATGLLGYLANRHGDYVCLETTWGTGIEVIRPSTRELDLERMLEIVHKRCTVDASTADLEKLLEFTTRAIRRRAIVLLVIDDVAFGPEIEVLLRRLAAQHDVLVLIIADVSADEAVANREHLINVDSGQHLPWFLGRDPLLTAQIEEQSRSRAQDRQALLNRLGIPHQQVTSSAGAIGAVFALLEESRRVRS